MTMIHQGNRPRISGLFAEVPHPSEGWVNVYSQSGRRSLRLVGDAVVPEGATATMEVYSGPCSARETVEFQAGTRLRLVRVGDPHTTCLVEVV